MNTVPPSTEYVISDEDFERLDNNFGDNYLSVDQLIRYLEIRSSAKALARKVLRFVPPSNERSLALTKIERAVRWAHAGIERNEENPGTNLNEKEKDNND